ncbi:MAG TPA: hypothetical protein VH518_13430, partial [Tepidisphaeraceae bacterium]
ASLSLGAVGAGTYTGTLTPNGTTYRFGGGGGSLTLPNANALTGARSVLLTGNMTLKLGALNNYTGGTTVNGGLLIANALNNGPLTINGGAVQITAKPQANDPSGTSVTGALAIDSSDAKLDLTNNSMVLDYTSSSPVGTVRQLLKAGAATGFGIVSSSATATTRIGYGDNAVLGKTTFAGQSVNSSSVLLKYTYAGDADLDGDADGVDIGTWATNFTGELGGTGSQVWTQGDWDYDGDVDGVDAGLWAQAFTGELGGAGLGSVVVDAPLKPEAAAILKGLGVTVVPEPALAGSIFLASAALVGCRRRSRARR